MILGLTLSYLELLEKETSGRGKKGAEKKRKEGRKKKREGGGRGRLEINKEKGQIC